jgi:hypothetical protein
MKENRKATRKIADEVLEVSDQITGTQIGRVVNISAEGLMLLSHEPVLTGSVYQLALELSAADGEAKQIMFGAEAIWTSETNQPESFWTGFRIIDIANEDVLLIDELIMDWNASK